MVTNNGRAHERKHPDRRKKKNREVCHLFKKVTISFNIKHL